MLGRERSAGHIQAACLMNSFYSNPQIVSSNFGQSNRSRVFGENGNGFNRLKDGWIMEFLQVSMKWPLFVALGGALALIG